MKAPLANTVDVPQRGFSQRFKLGPLDIFPNVNLSSMHGVSDYPFRRLISYLCEGETGWMITEFVSANELVKKNRNALRQLKYHESERPFGVQIYGGEPDIMAEAARMVQDTGIDYIEINCGCPAPKVVRRQCGSGLLLDLEHYRSVLASVKNAVNIPLSVKVRIGFYDSEINALESLKIAEEEGAEMFIVHGRTKQQGYKGLANWDVIKRVKEKACIPVIGNGDVLTVNDVTEKFLKYGVDGISVGRGALHNPWIFKQVLDLYQGRAPHEPGPLEQLKAMKYYHDRLLESYDYQGAALGKLKQLSARLLKGYPNNAAPRQKVLRSNTAEDFFENLETFFAGYGHETKTSFEHLNDLNGKTQKGS